MTFGDDGVTIDQTDMDSGIVLLSCWHVNWLHRCNTADVANCAGLDGIIVYS